jgi:hypothetical protein
MMHRVAVFELWESTESKKWFCREFKLEQRVMLSHGSSVELHQLQASLRSACDSLYGC